MPGARFEGKLRSEPKFKSPSDKHEFSIIAESLTLLIRSPKNYNNQKNHNLDS